MVNLFPYNRVMLLVGVVWLLSACAGLNAKFDKATPAGGVLASLSTVDEWVDQGKFHSVDHKSCCSKRRGAHRKRPRTEVEIDKKTVPDTAHQAMRLPEHVARVWISPYIDSQGNYHDAHTVFAVMSPGRWKGEPARVSAIMEDVSS